MKTKQIIIAVIILLLGVLIGKYAFNNSSQTIDEHVAKTEHWTCSMHPQIDLPEFGDCPICGMDLILKNDYSDDLASNTAFKMSKNAMALANIETVIIGNSENETSSNGLKLSGKISANENASAMQTAHFGGRIEKLYFKSKGEYVKKGALLATIYSPDLVTAQNELIEAMNIKDLQPELYTAVRNKLKNWKLSESQIKNIELNKKVITNFNMYANVSGYIDTIFAQEGNHVKEGSPLFKVSDLSQVWAIFDVYEQDISALKLGQEIRIKLNAYPDKKIISNINYIDPNLNISTRTISVRATLPNHNEELKPGMFITSSIELKSNNVLSSVVEIPKTAVLWTGKRSIVYVKTDKYNPVFELREVQLGNDLGENYAIASGLNNGEEIVVNGTFTVDAAAQLQGKRSMMNSEVREVRSGKIEDEIVKIEVNPKFKNQLNVVIQDYISMKDAFVLTDANEVSNKAMKALHDLDNVQISLLKKQEAHKIWMEALPKIKSSFKNIQQETNVENQRATFINLSETMIFLANSFGVNETIYVQHCPMANDNEGADWLSLEKQIRNPYYGDKMLKCGKVTQTLK